MMTKRDHGRVLRRTFRPFALMMNTIGMMMTHNHGWARLGWGESTATNRVPAGWGPVQRLIRSGGLRGAALALAMLVVAAGCSKGGSPTDPASWPAEVIVTPGTKTLVSLGETVQFSAVVRDQGGREMANVALEWTAEDPTILALESSGVFKALANGQTTVTARVVEATASGTRPSGSAIVEVDQQVAAVQVSATRGTLWAIGQVSQLSARAVDALGNVVEGVSGAVVWSSADPDIADVDGAGVLTALAEGVVEVEASLEGFTATRTFIVSPGATYTACVSSATTSGEEPGKCVGASFQIRDAAGFAVYVTR